VIVRNLAVNGFPGYGIEVRRQFGGIPNDRCFISSQFQLYVEIADNHLGRNQRGLGIFTIFSIVHDNVIRGNLRSGIYVADIHHTEIRHNTIENNGAGIFFNVGEPVFLPPSGADVLQNVIARNNGMGIARTRKGEILVRQNSMFDNLLQGIDIDVDARTPNREFDVDAPNHPVILSARYDPVQDATIVRGRLDSNVVHGLFTTSYVIDVYASSRLSVWGYPQAETFLQEVALFNGHEDFEIVVPGDLRGRWITATNTAFHFVGYARGPGTESHRSDLPGDTSELSNAVMVE
jgi:parallel beta-helix repeat protein